MSYVSTTIVIFGVKLNSEDSEKLNDYLIDNNLVNDNEEFLQDDCTTYPAGPNLPSYIDGIQQPKYDIPRTVHKVQLCSDGTDARVYSIWYEEGFIHYFGVYCGSNGYCYNDKINLIVKNIPQKAKDIFEKHCLPILKELNMDQTPTPQIFNQVH